MENKDNKGKKQFICPYANMPTCSPIADDEIDLLDIWKVLWHRRFLILVVTVLFTAAAAANAFFSPGIYETKVSIAPSSDLGVGLFLAEITSIIPDETISPTPATVYKSVLKNLQDRTVQAQFWAESEIVKWVNSGNGPHSVNWSENWFMQNLSVKFPQSKKRNQQVSVSLSGGDPDVIAEVLNDFISYLDDFFGREVCDNLKLKIAEKKRAIEVEIGVLRKNAERNSKRQIAQLSEQKAIAEKLKIIELPQDLANIPLYARGVNALQTEIDILQQRKNSDLFSKELSVLQVQLESIDNVDFSNVKISALQAEKALVPRQPQKPKQQLIVALGVVLGLMIGVFIAFLMNFIKNMRQKESDV